MDWSRLTDPFVLSKVLWPKDKLYDKQEEVVRSVWKNDKTIAIAGNKLGKDYVAGRIALLFFLTRTPCRVVTTSVDGTQLESVLWGEIGNAIQRSAIPLDHRKGGPLVINHMLIRRMFTSGPNKGSMCPRSFILGRVAKKGEGLLGYHVTDDDKLDSTEPLTLLIVDEASGVDDTSLNKVETWAKRQLYIGNAFECSNCFYRESEAGSIVDPNDSSRYYTKVIRITGHDSPNVRYAKAYEQAHGKKTNKQLLPGVLPYYEYQKWLATWDKIRVSVSIDAQFYKGAELLLFPPTWLDNSHRLAREARLSFKHRTARAMGIDPGEGAAETAWCVIDEYGILETVAIMTPNTADIRKQTLALMRKHNLSPEAVMFDSGGGGKQIADDLRDSGYYVRTVGFGETVKPLPKRGMTAIKHKIENNEERYAYLNRRAEMYGHLSEILNPDNPPANGFGFGISDRELELRRQLAPIPRKYDKEGRMYIPPKNKKDPNSKEKTLIEIIGQSPDRADALIIALYCRDYAPKRVQAGVA